MHRGDNHLTGFTWTFSEVVDEYTRMPSPGSTSACKFMSLIMASPMLIWSHEETKVLIPKLKWSNPYLAYVKEFQRVCMKMWSSEE